MIVGRQNIVAGTDGGLGDRVHADPAELRTLVENARLASTSLWPQLKMLVAVDEFPVQAVACACYVAGAVAYSLPSRSWIRPARRWRCTAIPIWFGRSLGHAT